MDTSFEAIRGVRFIPLVERPFAKDLSMGSFPTARYPPRRPIRYGRPR